MSFFNSLNQFVFRTRVGRLVVAAVAVLSGVILLNPLLSGIRATDQSDSSSLYSETGVYSDGTEVEIGYAGFGRPASKSMDSTHERLILRLISYKGSSRLPLDSMMFVSESTQIDNNENCDEQAFFQEFWGRASGFAWDTELPVYTEAKLGKHAEVLFDVRLLGDQVRYKPCIRWSIVEGGPRPIEPGSLSSSADYYLAIKIPETIGSPEVSHWFNRGGGQIYSRIGLRSHTLDFSEYGDVVIGDWLPGSISVGYQHRVVSDRAGCNQTRFPEQLLGYSGSNFKQYRSASLSETEHEILILPSHVGKYICYQIRWSDFGSSQFLHDTYFVTFEVPPITEPVVEVPPIDEFELYAIPDEFDLDEAVRVLRNLLTEEGLEDIEDTSFSLHPHGCIGRNEENAVGGCYDISENTIYIHTIKFPEDYAQRSRAEKARIIKAAMHVLAHEFWHRNDWASIGSSDIIRECHASRPEQTYHIIWGLVAINDTNESKRLSYLEELDFYTRQCMRDHPEWGHVFAGLEERFLDENNPDPVEPMDISSGRLWVCFAMCSGEDFSWNWYVEFYAETPTRNTHLLRSLENHYGRYFKNQFDFVQILRDDFDASGSDNLFFDIYER